MTQGLVIGVGPPLIPLKLWAMRKLGDSGFAYYIRARIAGKIPGRKGGLAPRQMFFKAWYQTCEQLGSQMDECHEKILERGAVA